MELEGSGRKTRWRKGQSRETDDVRSPEGMPLLRLQRAPSRRLPQGQGVQLLRQSRAPEESVREVESGAEEGGQGKNPEQDPKGKGTGSSAAAKNRRKAKERRKKKEEETDSEDEEEVRTSPRRRTYASDLILGLTDEHIISSVVDELIHDVISIRA